MEYANERRLKEMKNLLYKVGRGVIYVLVIISLVAPWVIAAPIFNLLGI